MSNRLEKIKLVLLGALTAIGLMLLMGAGDSSQVGRYRMSATLNYVNVIDTATGEWKTYALSTDPNEPPAIRASGKF